jgi:phage terminase large subunit
MLAVDPDAYDWVWEGHTRKNTASTIFRGKVFVEHFEMPELLPRFYHGADWGFAQDPTCLIRSYIMPSIVDDKHIADYLYIDREAYGWHMDVDKIPDLFDQIDTSREWPIKGDNSRPETISYVHRIGFNCTPAEKWQGSVEDGIAHLRGFRKIIIHPDCQEHSYGSPSIPGS